MAHRKKRQAGPQVHAEGQHGEKTHRHLIEQLQQPADERGAGERADAAPVKERYYRSQQDRQQHDQAEKGR